MKKIIILTTAFLLFINTAFSQQKEEVFHLSWMTDGILLGGALTLDSTDLLCDKVLKLNRMELPSTFDLSSVPSIDRAFMNPYSKGLDLTASATEGLLFAAPAIFLTLDKKEYLTVYTMYLETVMWTWGLKELGKLCVNRIRPYMYYDNPPSKAIADGDWSNSFPSGHTSFAFSLAGFTTYVFAKYYPDSAWKYPVAGLSYTLAFTVGALRMASGNHFLTDVLTGAAIGSLCGFVVPWLHTITPHKKNDNVEISLSPLSLDINIKL